MEGIPLGPPLIPFPQYIRAVGIASPAGKQPLDPFGLHCGELAPSMNIQLLT